MNSDSFYRALDFVCGWYQEFKDKKNGILAPTTVCPYLCGSGALYFFMGQNDIPLSSSFEVDDLDFVFPQSNSDIYTHAIDDFVLSLSGHPYKMDYTQHQAKQKPNEHSSTGFITLTDFDVHNFTNGNDLKISFIHFPTEDNNIWSVIKTYDIDIVQVAIPLGNSRPVVSEATKVAIKNKTATLLRQFQWKNTIPTNAELEFANSSIRRCIKYQNRGFKFSNGPKLILQAATIDLSDSDSEDGKIKPIDILSKKRKPACTRAPSRLTKHVRRSDRIYKGK